MLCPSSPTGSVFARTVWRCALFAVCSLLAGMALAVSFHVDVNTHSEPSPDSRAAPSDSRSAFDVTLADTFILVRADAQSTLYDFATRKRTVVDHGRNTRVEYSLYDTVGFRVFELHNREMLGKALAAAHVDANAMQSVDNEHILALQDKASTPLQVSVEDGNQVFVHEARVLFSRSLQASPVAADEARMFAQYIRYFFGGHPQVLEALAKGNAIPARLTLSAYGPGSVTQTVDISALLASDDQHLDLGMFPMRPALASMDPLDQLLDGAAVATDQDALAARVRIEAEIASLFAQDRAFDAFLTSIEWSLMTGEPNAALTPEQQATVQANQAVQLLSAALSSPRTPEGLSNGIRVLAELRAAAPAKSHVLKIFEANDRAMAGDLGTARKLLMDVLNANLFVASVYKDLGDVLLMDFDTPRAWRCWDQGRKFAPSFSNFEAVQQLENALATLHPEYF